MGIVRSKSHLLRRRGHFNTATICNSKNRNVCNVQVFECVTENYVTGRTYVAQTAADCYNLADATRNGIINWTWFAPQLNIGASGTIRKCADPIIWWQLETCGMNCADCSPAGCVGPGIAGFVTQPFLFPNVHYACPACIGEGIECIDGWIWLSPPPFQACLKPGTTILTPMTTPVPPGVVILH